MSEPPSPRRLCGIGYEGLTLERFIEIIHSAGVRTVVDVRLTPVSRRPGFSKRGLGAALSQRGVTYVHEPDLGNPPENRASFHTDDPSRGRQRMRAILSGRAAPALERLVQLARHQSVAIMCVERLEQHCHRQVILEMAHELDPTVGTGDIR